MAKSPLSRLNRAWREIAQGTARSLGLTTLAAASGDRQSLEALMRECLEARGGEISARMRAAELGQTYLELDEEGKAVFLDLLASNFAIDPDYVSKEAAAYQAAADEAARARAERNLRAALEAPRLKLLTKCAVPKRWSRETVSLCHMATASSRILPAVQRRMPARTCSKH